MFTKPQRVRRRLKVAIFGTWKTGKTRGALSFPKPAVIDTHRGTDFYDENYDFQVLHASKWTEMEAPIAWVKKNAAAKGIETLVIDDLSTIYDDLVNEVALYRQNKSGSNAPLSSGDWGVIKRRWKAFLMLLIRLDVNVVLVVREKEEYADSKDDQGREVRKKTGEVLMDADKQTGHVFDFILHAYTEENPKKATSKFMIRVKGTRHKKLPKYSVHDITGKLLYETLFEAIAEDVAKGAAVPESEKVDGGTAATEEPLEIPEGNSAVENNREILEKFGTTKIDPSLPEATDEDRKILFTRAGEMSWPDETSKCRAQSCSKRAHKHPPFTSEDGKSLIRGHYGVESSKELRKPQVDFLYAEFGKVLAGLAYLERDEKGIPFVATPSGVSDEEIKAKVEADWTEK